MFNVSLKVSDAKLADTLIRLQTIIPGGVEVTRIGEESQLASTPASRLPGPATPATPKLVKVRQHKRAYKGRGAGIDTQQNKAVEVLSTLGVPPFAVKEYLDRCEAKGVGKPAAYRAIRIETQSGNLKKLEPGRYQRTGAGFAKAVVSDLREKQA